MKKQISVLLVEDQQAEAIVVTRLLSHSAYGNFSVTVAVALADAIEQLGKNSFDACLLDLGLPDGHGIESLRQVRSVDGCIPIVVLTGNDDENNGLTAIETGAQDYLAKDFVNSRTVSRALLFAIARQNTMLGHAADAQTDMLTGLPNRRLLSRDFDRMSNQFDLLSVALLDIDNFKTINDLHGHLIGDRVLQHVASLVRDNAGNNIQAARFGGEEFTLLIPDSGIDATVDYASDLLSKIENATLEIDGKSISVTASIGLTSVRNEEGLDESLRRADQALYSAKHTGRNRVCVNDA
ncbi:GGDEF domain-containing response regulator [Rubripirellula reticaptiva]|uniref:diguanylate cyclase n=1 Tax=Rubripirellula reticaptiva TaxID=2528013 RepID=A0A5C6EF72_9BACT|nr:diguanylate cyclase [Rubripirellula reticaptiva]TWU47104.1 Diguanylate cyclase YdeH [Rubripirellula reticaptiva]